MLKMTRKTNFHSFFIQLLLSDIIVNVCVRNA